VVQVAPFPFLKVINSLEIYTNYPHYLLWPFLCNHGHIEPLSFS